MSRRQRAAGHTLATKVLCGLLSSLRISVSAIYIQAVCRGAGMDSSSQQSHSKHHSLPWQFSDSGETFIYRVWDSATEDAKPMQRITLSNSRIKDRRCNNCDNFLRHLSWYSEDGTTPSPWRIWDTDVIVTTMEYHQEENVKEKTLSPIGKLSFTVKVIPASRIFLRRLIDLSTTVKKLHHHITLTAGARVDIQLWQDFLPGWSGVSLIL